MAVTADVVQVRLEADTARYVGNIKAADAAFNSAAANITANAARVNTATNGIQLNTANIAAQFQDIGVTAAMGMNPLQIALQQGTQLSAVLNQSVSQGINPVKALGAAFVQIINPVSLTTIALIAAGTAAIQYFGTILSQGDMSNEEIKKQEDAIRRVADRWGDAVPALKAYVDQLDRAAEASDIGITREVLQTTIWEDLRGQIGDWRAELSAARIDVQRFGGDAQEIDALQTAFDAVAEGVRNGSASVEDLEQLMAVLAATSGSSVIPSLVNLQSVLAGLVGQLNAAAAAQEGLNTAFAATAQIDAYNANQEFVTEQQRINSLTAEQLSLENEISRVKAQAERDGTRLSEAQALTLATESLAAAERRRAEAAATRGGTKQQTQAEREADAVLAYIEQLEHEYRLLGASNLEREVANGLRQAGAAATEKQAEYIRNLITATYSEQEAIDALNKSSQEWADTIQQATRGFIDDLIAGKSAAEAFSNVLSSIANKLIDVGLNSLFGTGGFNVAGLFGGGTPTLATGGPIYPGGPTLVGEKGPELFIPSGPGKIVPNSQIGGGGSVVFAPNIDARGADAGAVARIEQTLQRVSSEIVPTIRKEMATAHKKGRA